MHSKYTCIKHYISLFLLGCSLLVSFSFTTPDSSISKQQFITPTEVSRPGVYWYFMDGNISKEGITKDLESMKQAGIGYAIVLEVNIGIPRGNIDFMSDEWLNRMEYIIHESERLGIQLTLGVGPGWSGSGGPWVKGEQSMQHLVASTSIVKGEGKQKIQLPIPQPRKPFFGTGNFTDEMKKHWEDYYKDVAVLAFPTPKEKQLLNDSDEKALYYRAPYSSQANVKQFLPTTGAYDLPTDSKAIINKNTIIDLTQLLQPGGTIEWNVPEGSWTIMRFGSRNNGAVTRPAPLPGIGMEADKFDSLAMKEHLSHFTDKIFKKIAQLPNHSTGGIKMLHIDSWEMGAQNWSAHFREEFIRRRGYDPQPFYPAYLGLIVQDREISERFLWDVRQTSQELIIENHAGYVKKYSHQHGLGLSIEPYDMNPAADLELGVVADMPMCEFWSNGYGFNTSFSVIEATSGSHLIGQPVVPAESFTAANDLWRQYPGSMKDQTDWAFASGINRLMFHTFQHQCLNDSLRPGITMGVYGVHWDRNQTWWNMAIGYHKYVARCQYMLQQGRTVADILYLIPEGAPHVFRAPASAIESIIPSMPDRKGYNFDACPPSLLYKATVENGEIIFPGGACYRVLLLPDCKTMTPQLLGKIEMLIRQGATVITKSMPDKSPSLSHFPSCDQEVKQIAQKLMSKDGSTEKIYENGKIIYYPEPSDSLYQPYPQTASILSSMHIQPDFVSNQNVIRYTHRTTQTEEIYFVSNRTDKNILTECTFRISNKVPELWNPMNGEIYRLTKYTTSNNVTTIPLQFEGNEAYFIVFKQKQKTTPDIKKFNYSSYATLDTLKGAWNVSFDTKWGGPKSIVFKQLTDWTQNENEGIKYYSGKAVYKQTFHFSKFKAGEQYYLNINNVKAMAHVWLNGKDLGIVWFHPYRLKITDALKAGTNMIRIEVVNLWPNRLIGDAQYADDGVQNGQWPEWLIKDEKRKSKRYTFTTYNKYKKDDPLLESGLIGPICIMKGVDHILRTN